MALLTETGKKFPSSRCYMCYICPDDCYVRSPPADPSPPPAAASDGPHLSTFLILMLCLLALAFLVLSYLTIRRYRFSLANSRLGGLAGLENGDFEGPGMDHPAWFIRTVGLPQSAIESIPVFEFKKYGKLIEGKDCSVCLNEFQDCERIRVLPKCRHAFHLPCIDPWLRSHTNCPVCRALVVIAHEETILPPGDENQGQNESSNQIRIEIDEIQGVQGSNIERRGNVRVLSDLADRRVKLKEFPGDRRAVSLDFSSEFMMNEVVEKLNPGKRSCKNLSGRFLQRGPILMKRSFSFGGKRSVRKNNRRSVDSVSIM